MIVPLAWLKNETTIYPITIDPTIHTNLSVSEDIHMKDDTDPIVRADNTVRLRSGATATTPSISKRYRAVIDWNISAIPDSADILNLSLLLFAGDPATPFNYNASITHMDGSIASYPDDPPGNDALFEDIGNGTAYTTAFHNALGPHYFNISNATAEFVSKLPTDSFSIGILNLRDNSIPLTENQTEWSYAPSEYSNVNQRPVLTVTYSIAGANETEGDAAITQGILNSLPTAVIHPEQQVYTRSAAGTQQLGRFDRIAIFNNQRWAFNYITSGESFTNMNNISTNFYVLELTDLFASDITARVAALISGTKL